MTRYIPARETDTDDLRFVNARCKRVVRPIVNASGDVAIDVLDECALEIFERLVVPVADREDLLPESPSARPIRTCWCHS